MFLRFSFSEAEVVFPSCSIVANDVNVSRSWCASQPQHEKVTWHGCKHQDSDSSKKSYGHHKVQLPVTLLTTFVSRLLPVNFIYLKIRI